MLLFKVCLPSVGWFCVDYWWVHAGRFGCLLVWFVCLIVLVRCFCGIVFMIVLVFCCGFSVCLMIGLLVVGCGWLFYVLVNAGSVLLSIRCCVYYLCLC